MSSATCDVVVGGGSVAGLSFAAEAARLGLRVVVLEEDEEVGEPEKCDGLVSLRSLERFIAPEPDCIQSEVRRGMLFAPSGAVATLEASKLGVVVIDRSAYEQQLLKLATSAGADVRTSARVTSVTESGGRVTVSSGSGLSITSSYYVDATGPAAILRQDRKGLIPAAKYEVRADWFTDGDVEVHLDQRKYPGFFAWVIPRGSGLAKVGVAGYGINSFRTLDSFLATRGRFEVVTRVAAPIYLGGPARSFVSGRTVFVGESAGQVKPTTAGGILGSVGGGMMAARWTHQSLTRGDPALLSNYQAEWEETFGKEFRTMKRLRRVFTDLSNDDLEKIVSILSSKRLAEKLASTDFDYHATALLSALGVQGTLRLASVLLSVEARDALSALAR